MVEPHALAKLANAGNVKTVEEEWMKLLESPATTLERIASYAPALAGLAKSDNADQAGALAWAAIELMSDKFAAEGVVSVAGKLLVAVGNHAELRSQVTDLYKATYSDREGLDELIKEAGLAEGRPVRRAVRTMDTCLPLAEGDYLVSRDEDEDEAARVEKIDKTTWDFEIALPDGEEDIGAVKLADRFMKTFAEDFRVRKHFFKDELRQQFDDEPAEVVIAIAKLHGGDVSRDQLEMSVVPKYLTPVEWKKWWTKARTALKKYSNVQIERKSPYTISCTDEGISPQDLHLSNFNKTHEPCEQYGLVENYIKECKARGEEPDEAILLECHANFVRKAERFIKANNKSAGAAAAIARKVGEVAGVEGSEQIALDLFGKSDQLDVLFAHIERDDIHAVACRTLEDSRPDSWADEMLQLMPYFPLGACDRESNRLLEAGRTDFDASVEQIFAEPVDCFEAMLWLWNGPDAGDKIPQKPLVSTLSRLLRALDEVRRNDQMDRERVKRIATRARSVLAARKYERFKACLEEIEQPMASALKTQISRLDNLGRAVKEDMQRALREKFPNLELKPESPPWEREDVLFVTRSGYMKKQDEIDQHVNVKMKENARAIGAAAEHGDLSENSEYKFALEERDLLRARLAQMNSEMGMAQILELSQVPTDVLGIGTKATFKRVTDGEVFEMTMVGPWESDPDTGRYNYRAPLAQKVMGCKVGDEVEFDHGKANGHYELVELVIGIEELSETAVGTAGNG